MNTYRQCEELVRKGLIRHIGISNMTIPKMEAVLPLMEIMPSACESEMHVCFQQKEIFDYLTEHKIQPIRFMPPLISFWCLALAFRWLTSTASVSVAAIMIAF